jgi:hypothetical protein
MRNTAAETKRGNDGEMDSKIPAVMGAITPVLIVSEATLAQLTID